MKNYTDTVAIFYLSTKSECERGEVAQSIKYYLENLDTDKSFDIFICTDQKLNHKERNNLIAYETDSHVNSIKFYDNNIPDEFNIYSKPWIDNYVFDLDKLNMGRSHGINLHFYETLDYLLSLPKYKSFLLLEADTKPLRNDWFDRCVSYVNNNNFKIAGSLYKGLNREVHMGTYYDGHLNGVGLYRNSKELKRFLKNSRKYLIDALANDTNNKESPSIYYEFMNYDVATFLYAKEVDELDGYNNINMFINASADEDIIFEIEDVLKEFPGATFLHRKGLY